MSVNEDDVPEGVTKDDIGRQAIRMAWAAALVNMATVYMNAPEGSGEEDVALESAVQFADKIAASNQTSSMLLTFATIIAEIADQKSVRDWFNATMSRYESLLGSDDD